jgi:hypothetical protein
LAGGLLIVSAVWAALWWASLWSFTLDDAFITLRYAKNLAAGHGATFNAQAPPVEGYTTFLWMVVTTLPHLLGLDAVLFAKLVGVAATVATVPVALRWVSTFADLSQLHERRFLAAIVALTFASFPQLLIHAVSGMETAFFTLLVTWFACQTARGVQDLTAQRCRMAALGALLLGLTRPEGNLIAAVSLGTMWLLLDSEGRRRLAIASVVYYVLPGAVYFLIRFAYYDVLFPLPFYLKVAKGGGWLKGWYEVATYLMAVGLHVGPLVVLGVTQLGRPALPSVAGIAGFVAFYLLPEHVMGLHWRFLVPSAPLLLTVAALGVLAVWRWQLAAGMSVRTATGVCALILMVVAVDWVPDMREVVADGRRYGAGLHNAHIELGQALAAVKPDGRLAIADAGATPYYSNWQTIDTFGLNNPTIALSLTHDPGDVLKANPDVLVLISGESASFKPLLPWAQALHDASVERGYHAVGSLRFDERYYLWLMVNDATLATRLQDRLGAKLLVASIDARVRR